MTNNPGQTDVNRVTAITAASLISAAGSAVFLLLPLLLGGAAEALVLDDERTGLIASSYFLGFLLVCLSAPLWIRRLNWRRVGWGGFGLLSGGLLAGAYSDNYNLLLTAMALSGIGAGTVFGLAICVISDTREPDRNFGFKLVAEQVIGAALLFLLPVFVTPVWGFKGLMVSLAVVLGLLALAIPWLPERSARDSNQAGTSTGSAGNFPVWIALTALMVYFAGLSGLWAFVERLAADHLISAEAIGQALSIGVIGGGFGALAAGLLADRFGRVWPLLGSTLVLGGVLAIYAGPLTAFSFTLGTVLFSGVWNFGLAYQMGMVVSLDRKGNLSVLISSFLSLGAIIGPALAGMLIRGDDYGGVFVFTGVAMVVGLAAFLVLLTRTSLAPTVAVAQP
ncbi:MAG: MFS transporter [Halopseudomonas sp.]